MKATGKCLSRLFLLLFVVFMTNISFSQITIPDNSGRRELNEVQEETFTVVEVQPSYPGGEEAMMRYLAENIYYPQEARMSGIQGTVYVSFVVERDGSIVDVRVFKKIGGGCDEEAIRVVSKMPKWKPGMQKGKAVRVQFNMPIKFTLAS